MSATATTIICFDLGGVVVRIARSWREACAAAGLPQPDEQRLLRDDLRRVRAAASDDYQAGRLACDQYFTHIAAHTDGLYSPDDIRRIHNAWVFDEYPGVLPLITALNSAPGVLTACLSNTNHAHWQPLTNPQRSPAIAALTLPLVSHELGAVKPDSRIYQLADERFTHRLGRAPDRVIFFDDLPENVAAARAHGWDAHRIDHAGDTAAQMRAHLRALRILTGEAADP